MRILLFSPLFACLVSLAHAQVLNCESPGTQLELNQCAAEAYRYADRSLNKTYAELRARLSEAQRQALKSAQSAWVKFRDLDCKFGASGVQGGSASGLVVSTCLTRRTDQRIKELEAFLHCPEGDVSCLTLK